MLRGDLEVAQNKLHKKYRPLIRIAPEEVSCADASVIPLVYPSHSPLPKTDWYHIFTPKGLSENADLFSETNEEKHTKRRKIVSPAYQMSSVRRNEPAIDECITLFTKQVRELAAKKEVINLGEWINFYAHDRSFLNALNKAVPFIYVIAAAPNYMRKALMFLSIFIPGTLGHLQAIQATTYAAKQQTQLRMERSTQEKDSRPDILSQLLRISRKLNQKNHLPSTPVSYNETVKHLPYIGACIKEALRLFPTVGFSLPRVAPPQGIVLKGRNIPSGYVVGVNPHTIQFNTEVFGDDAEEFRPERWLESQARNFEMEKNLLSFGAGTRTCVGKNIALAEMYKFIPEVLRNFDIYMAHDGPLKTWNAGFIRQNGLITRIAEQA
ncbi:hypothetical protein COCVIDRAFT_42775 [Bipolaris victoriae FI3]|uniref:Cytochrome P450 n=1 Tax=Bipolaris victoriae (strain FI3) TaxID=930091 RepID=W7EAT3_BIPV3|nr:hypothetical protein COCVIDRAFT_42775 [Bipolaris victoriae FI3]